METPSLESLRAFVDGAGIRRPPALRPGVTVVGAGKGGVGTSTAALLLAGAAAREGATVLLVDGDEHVSSLALLTGADAGTPGLWSLAPPDSRDPRELVVRLAPGLDLVPGGGGGVEASLASAPGQRRVLFRRLSSLYDRYDLVLVDAGGRLDSVLAATAPGVGRLLVVTTSDRVALAGAYALLKVFHLRAPGVGTGLLVSGEEDAGGRTVHAVAAQAARRFLDLPLRYAGSVPRDPAVEDAVARGSSLAHLDPDAPAARAAHGVARELLRDSAPPEVPVLPLPVR